MNNLALIIVLGLSELIAFMLILRMWLKELGSVGMRLTWTFILLLPLLGPILYATMDPPSVQTDKPEGIDWDRVPGRHDNVHDDLD